LRAASPAFIPSNHMIEPAIALAVERLDLGPFEEMMTVLARPFDDQPDFARCGAPPLPEESALRTFRGT